jgi:drug/metabolite transporter (DMT)-like permease
MASFHFRKTVLQNFDFLCACGKITSLLIAAESDACDRRSCEEFAMSRTTTWLKLGLTALFWGLMFHLGKHAVGFMSPESIGGWRFLLAALVLVPVVGLRDGLDWASLRRNLLPLTAMAVIGIGGFNVALFYGLKQTSPVNGALIMALCPALITFFLRAAHA